MLLIVCTLCRRGDVVCAAMRSRAGAVSYLNAALGGGEPVVGPRTGNSTLALGLAEMLMVVNLNNGGF
jgi:hypothetical protein